LAAVALITGASGLIGTHVLEHWDVDELGAQPVDRARDDLLVPGAPTALVERVRPRVVIHLAWAASGTPGYRHAGDNERWVPASVELACVCRKVGAAFVATGTPLDKSTVPGDAYASSKVELWRQLEAAVADGEITWLRPYYVIDPERRRPALIDHALSAQAVGTPVVLRTPDSEHDFIHASDVGRAIVLAVRAQLRGEVPIGSGRLRRVCDLVAALGVPWESAAQPAGPGEGHLSDVADIHRLTELGWAPTRTDEFFDGG
jgi:nucleoside-diphosphate-sugar epimerase